MKTSEFATTAGAGRWKAARHFEYLDDKLEDVESGSSKRLAIFAPPRHGISTFLAYFVAKYIKSNPGKRIAWISSHSELAGTTVGRIREAVGAFDFARSPVKPCCVSDGMLGHAFDLIVLEGSFDFNQNTPDRVEKYFDWYKSAVATRILPGGKLILNYPRMGGGCLASKIVDSDDFDIVKMPAIAGPRDQIGRAEGEPLWPEQYCLEDLKRRRRQEPWWFEVLWQHETAPELEQAAS